jgi:hypothetical protein
MTELTPEKRADLRRKAEAGARWTAIAKYALLDALDAKDFTIRELRKRLNVPDRCACGGLNVGGVCTSCESCHYCGCPVSAPIDLLGLLASNAQENVRHARMLRGVVAPCLQCGDDLQKCIAQQCCIGCNHASKGTP